MKSGNLCVVLIPVMLFFVSGCGNSSIEQLKLGLSKGYGASFENGKLEGHRTYGYDASYLHDAIVSYLEGEKQRLEKMSEKELCKYFPLVYFVALKYEDVPGRKTKMDGTCFRLQASAIDYLPSSKELRDDDAFVADSGSQCFTFFFTTECGQIEILSVDLSRNPRRRFGVEDRNFSYKSINTPIHVWDAYMQDRNHPERVLGGKYNKVFAVMTDRPFNYMFYATANGLELVESLNGSSVLRLCWRTPECMIFIPEALLVDQIKAGNALN